MSYNSNVKSMTSQPYLPADSRRLFLATCDGEKTTARIATEAEMERDAAEFAEELIEIIKSTMAAQCVLDEMARRRGKHVPASEFSWHDVTAEFRAQFAEAYERKPREQSAQAFAREFVDSWPIGSRVVPSPFPAAVSPIPVVWPQSD
jgi:hypothetical protein